MTVAGGPALRVAEWPRLGLLMLTGAIAALSLIAIARAEALDTIVMAVVIGAAHGVSFYLLQQRHRWAGDASAVAGAMLVGWIVTQAAVLRVFTMGQALPLLLGAVTLGLGLYLASRHMIAPGWRRLGRSPLAPAVARR